MHSSQHNNTQNRLPNYPENSTTNNNASQFYRYQPQDAQTARLTSDSQLVIGDPVMVQTHPHTSLPSIPHQPIQGNIQSQQMQHHVPNQQQPNSPNVHVHHHQIVGPNGQLISIQGPGNFGSSPQVPNNVISQIPGGGIIANHHNNVVIQGSPQQQRIFINGQPNEPNAPGRPSIQMVPVSVSSSRPEMIQRLPQPFYNQPAQYQIQQFDPNKNIRPSFITNSQIINGVPVQQNLQGGQLQNAVSITQQQPQPKMWQNRIQTSQNQLVIAPQSPQNMGPNIYERVPPLHQHTPQANVWQDDANNRKKFKMGKVKKRPYVVENPHRMMEAGGAPCPNIDVRQIQNDGGRVLVNQFPQTNNQGASSPSFLEDPSGYLAQQTALLNSTINRQTGKTGAFVSMFSVTEIDDRFRKSVG